MASVSLIHSVVFVELGETNFVSIASVAMTCIEEVATATSEGFVSWQLTIE